MFLFLGVPNLERLSITFELPNLQCLMIIHEYGHHGSYAWMYSFPTCVLFDRKRERFVTSPLKNQQMDDRIKKWYFVCVPRSVTNPFHDAKPTEWRHHSEIQAELPGCPVALTNALRTPIGRSIASVWPPNRSSMRHWTPSRCDPLDMLWTKIDAGEATSNMNNFGYICGFRSIIAWCPLVS